MYNAMLRKGYTDTPAEHVESMVAVHNFLNEGAWEEIKGWEDRFREGLGKAWERCAKGEEGYSQSQTMESLRRQNDREEYYGPSLLRFEGRPNDITPKARILGLMSSVLPSQYPDNPPFDRHDWVSAMDHAVMGKDMLTLVQYVERQGPGGQKKELRYVIGTFRTIYLH